MFQSQNGGLYVSSVTSDKKKLANYKLGIIFFFAFTLCYKEERKSKEDGPRETESNQGSTKETVESKHGATTEIGKANKKVPSRGME
ncbi:hypothetical protein CDAR_54381 [Caerostris darwini]|uniref:Uncharacterized protein n=1 Tax=Caerostris darwini TaxID=1538125 RepID=A0AAV4WAP6_9ARAC|nr:hypothetical protein CDAR_54381 [Caerostris darwini]